MQAMSSKTQNDWRMLLRAAEGCVVARVGRERRRHSEGGSRISGEEEIWGRPSDEWGPAVY